MEGDHLSVPNTDIKEALKEWSVGPVLEVARDPHGTINQTWLITAETGRYALQLSAQKDASRLQRLCDLLAFASDAGIPAIRSLKTIDGKFFVQRDDGFWMLYPFAPGFQTDRDVMTPEQDRGMGRCLAKLVEALSDCPEHLGRRRSPGVNVEKSLEEIERFERLIRDYPNPAEYETYALDRLDGRRKWILDHADENTSGIDDLPHQVIHGDYQEKNVFFNEAGDVVALIDWDNAWMGPREWEIFRTLNFVMSFDPVRGKTFVDGYLEFGDLDFEALDRAAWAYGVSRTHSLFIFEEIYDRKSDRIRRFLNPGPFQPVYDRWVPLKNALDELR
jgi:Ser/Thr protein kinase RdoA (MazF antagonist)